MSTIQAIKKFIETESGKALISIILGLGVASLFRKKPCSYGKSETEKRDCYKFVSPDMKTVEEKVFKYGDQCFSYSSKSSPCDQSKTKVSIYSHYDE